MGKNKRLEITEENMLIPVHLETEINGLISKYGNNSSELRNSMYRIMKQIIVINANWLANNRDKISKNWNERVKKIICAFVSYSEKHKFYKPEICIKETANRLKCTESEVRTIVYSYGTIIK